MKERTDEAVRRLQALGYKGPYTNGDPHTTTMQFPTDRDQGPRITARIHEFDWQRHGSDYFAIEVGIVTPVRIGDAEQWMTLMLFGVSLTLDELCDNYDKYVKSLLASWRALHQGTKP